MKLFYAALIVLGITLLLLPAMAAAATPDCYEDQPCFVWSKIGNHKRGVNVWQGGIVVTRVVGPCTYAKLYYAKRIDSTTVKLRGDWWARHHGCEQRL
jgi:hypothetical protein